MLAPLMFSDMRWPNIYLEQVPDNLNEEAQQIARQLRQELGLGLDPLDLIRLLEVARAGGFRAVVTFVKKKKFWYQARLVPEDNNTFLIELVIVDAQNNKTVQLIQLTNIPPQLKFQFAHEVAHSFYFDRTGERPTRQQINDEREERFCDEFARCFLFPMEVIGIQECNNSPERKLEHLFLLSDEFGVSREMAGRQFSAVDSSCYYAGWMDADSAYGGLTQLCLKWMYACNAGKKNHELILSLTPEQMNELATSCFTSITKPVFDDSPWRPREIHIKKQQRKKLYVAIIII